LRAYVPFAIFVLVVLLLLAGIGWLVASVLDGGHAPAAGQATVATATPAASPGGATLPGHTTDVTPTAALAGHVASVASRVGTTTLPATFIPSDTAIQSDLVANTPTIPAGAIAPGKPLPTRAPLPASVPDGNSSLVIARAVDLARRPLEQAVHFVSPALRLYAVATVHHVKSSDMLRFVFERNGKTLAGDDISFGAGASGANLRFDAYADYKEGAGPLPHGAYVVLFYRNGRLEAERAFRVG
jgi:hypothetical protein